ncbi:F-box/kelch-repeat protein At3g06240-like [Rhododendron vialii]|uniref:F-box/kelch-repeat protein At3g06240-like n=1 Tax=Rhododendron vialii TaxID=182163 RepID=UPI0026600406|nr:F-box/kelch-repeat protein At3g06240-like [Rhododendron vialii]
MAAAAATVYGNGTLPEEILTDILSRLPVKPLCRFKCVSPSWNSLISDPYFVKTHLNRTDTLKNPKHPYQNKIIISTCDNLYSVRKSEKKNLYSVDLTNLNPTITKLDFPTTARHAAVRSSCDGLLLASNSDHSILFLLNPSTGERNKLPTRPPVLDPVQMIHGSHSGLGYDSSTDDYKVVIFTRYKTEFSPFFSILDVYSLKTNAWRRIKCLHYCPMGNNGGVFLKGCIHGLCWRVGSIVAFYLSDEVFREVPTPASFRQGKICSYDVAVFGGCLCLVKKGKTEVWMMMEYGVRESWTEFTIHSGFRMARLLCLLAEDEFLLSTYGERGLNQLVVYNQQKDTARDMVVCDIPPRFSFEGTYAESLISPHHGRGNGGQ